MKIAYILTSLRDTGVTHVVEDIIKMMIQYGHECKVFVFKKVDDVHLPCKVEYITLFTKIPFDDFDVVHAHCFRADLYCFLHTPIRCKTLFINTIHSYIFQDYRNSMGQIKGTIVAFIELVFMLRLDYCVCLSKEAINYYRRFLNKKKLTYCYNTKSIDYSKQISLKEKQHIESFKKKVEFVCGSICVVSDIKGLDQIIRALVLLPNVGYIIIGEGPSFNKLKNLAVQLGVENRVLFLGFKVDAYRFIPFFDVFCMPSRSEGFGVSMIEAAAYAKPIVSTNLSIFSEIFSDTESIKFPIDNIKECADAIIKAYNYSDLGYNAFNKFENKYSPYKFYQKYIQIYSLQKNV